MPSRKYSLASSGYRFGFNKGSEKDNEIYSQKDRMISTYFREGDVYTLRWWGADPKPNASESNYMWMGGNPILNNDPAGDVLNGADTKYNLMSAKGWVNLTKSAISLGKDIVVGTANATYIYLQILTPRQATMGSDGVPCDTDKRYLRELSRCKRNDQYHASKYNTNYGCRSKNC